MTLKLTIDLPDKLAEKARQAGLLESDQVAAMLERELERHKAREDFKEMVDKVRSQPGEPMTLEEIQVEVNAVRAERRRESGH